MPSNFLAFGRHFRATSRSSPPRRGACGAHGASRPRVPPSPARSFSPSPCLGGARAPARPLFNFSLNLLDKNAKKTTVFTPKDPRKCRHATMPRDHPDSLYFPPSYLREVLSAPICAPPAATPASGVTRISRLDNGLTVASQETRSQMSAIGLYVKAGTRYEDSTTYGTCVLLERLSFRSTLEHTAAEVVGALENMGVHVTTSSSRECMVYSAEVLRELLDPMLSMLANTILRPKITEEDLSLQVKRLQEDMQNNRRHPAAYLPEVLHEVAYAGSPLARSLIVPDEQLASITPQVIRKYLKNYFIGPRMVLAGASVDHEQFVELASKHFSPIPKNPESPPDLSETPSSYVGGMRLVPPADDSEKLEHAHVSVAFECCGLNDPQFFVTYTLSMLMGGGMSFSAGGPGKGMYTRLNTNVINRYGWVESCEAFISSYIDTGIFGITGSCSVRHTSAFLDILCDQLTRISTHLTEEEVSRAKNQTKTSIFYNLETLNVLHDDIGRHVMIFGKRITPGELSKMIDTITPSDIRTCVQRILSTPPTVVVYAPTSVLDKVQDYDSIKRYFEEHTA
ncbi:uncharacterized protein LOC126320396 [Schistocerca gregaria]|uniref:uncharacterized protein LOC126320396 n=1 Tax=Schistocerca gregaria TaxID=7010 RepID=UPI00211E2FD3|nr:uncharacterized protein LOC126320396 [Schistocerca gregaria]